MSGDIELNHGLNNNSSMCRVLYFNISCLYNNISDLQIASPKYDIILSSENLVFSHRHVSEVLLSDFKKASLLLCETRLHVYGLTAYIRFGYSTTIRKFNICNCHEVQLSGVCSRLNNLYDFSLYCNPNLFIHYMTASFLL